MHWDKSDIYGHVDGMMAIADDGSLITDLSWKYLIYLVDGCNYLWYVIFNVWLARRIARIDRAK